MREERSSGCEGERLVIRVGGGGWWGGKECGRQHQHMALFCVLWNTFQITSMVGVMAGIIGSSPFLGRKSVGLKIAHTTKCWPMFAINILHLFSWPIHAHSNVFKYRREEVPELAALQAECFYEPLPVGPLNKLLQFSFQVSTCLCLEEFLGKGV